MFRALFVALILGSAASAQPDPPRARPPSDSVQALPSPRRTGAEASTRAPARSLTALLASEYRAVQAVLSGLATGEAPEASRSPQRGSEASEVGPAEGEAAEAAGSLFGFRVVEACLARYGAKAWEHLASAFGEGSRERRLAGTDGGGLRRPR